MKKIDLKTNQTKIIKLDQPGEYQINLLASGAKVKVIGNFLVEKKDQLLVNITIRHLAPHTQSITLLKAVGMDQSFTKLVGRIIIAADCFGSIASLTEKTLLVSEKARAETVPELEIKNHDVQCSHAASITHINQTELFYLMSRGLSRVEAEKMIIAGFLSDL